MISDDELADALDGVMAALSTAGHALQDLRKAIEERRIAQYERRSAVTTTTAINGGRPDISPTPADWTMDDWTAAWSTSNASHVLSGSGNYLLPLKTPWGAITGLEGPDEYLRCIAITRARRQCRNLINSYAAPTQLLDQDGTWKSGLRLDETQAERIATGLCATHRHLAGLPTRPNKNE
jgi:hypothetical protein